MLHVEVVGGYVVISADEAFPECLGPDERVEREFEELDQVYGPRADILALSRGGHPCIGSCGGSISAAIMEFVSGQNRKRDSRRHRRIMYLGLACLRTGARPIEDGMEEVDMLSRGRRDGRDAAGKPVQRPASWILIPILEGG